MGSNPVKNRPGGLSILSFITGLIPGILSLFTLISISFLYLGQRFNIYPFGASEIWGLKDLIIFSIWWIYLIIWLAIIFVPIPAIVSIISGSFDLSKNKAGSLNRAGRKLDIAGILLALSPIIVIGIYFIPAVSGLISKIPG